MTLYQFGFTKKHSTQCNLLMQKEIIFDALEHERYALTIFIDYSKAFHSMNRVTFKNARTLRLQRLFPLCHQVVPTKRAY